MNEGQFESLLVVGGGVGAKTKGSGGSSSSIPEEGQVDVGIVFVCKVGVAQRRQSRQGGQGRDVIVIKLDNSFSSVADISTAIAVAEADRHGLLDLIVAETQGGPLVAVMGGSRCKLFSLVLVFAYDSWVGHVVGVFKKSDFVGEGDVGT